MEEIRIFEAIADEPLRIPQKGVIECQREREAVKEQTRLMKADLDDIPPYREAAPATDHPDRKVQIIEVAVFLFLIVPPMATSFLIDGQSDVGFKTGAAFSMLSDLGLISLVFYFIWRNGEPLRSIGLTRRNLSKEVVWGLALFFPIMYGTNQLSNVLHSAGLSAPTKLPSFLVAKGHAGLFVAIVLVIVVAVAEETIFRGYLIRRLNTATRRPWASVVLSSVIFSIGHGYEGMAGVISIFCLGAVLAVVYLWRKSLVAPMVIHFCIDFSTIVVAAWIMPGG
jgi:membrane protease YdiL (CAAX protease family)